MNPIVLHTFKMPITVCLEGEQRREAQRLLNQHYLQDDECNTTIDGKYVSKYPEFEKAHPEFAESHYAVCHSYLNSIEVELLSNGRLRIKKL